jgi:drug/metabolite transporter (DMT)-like permease
MKHILYLLLCLIWGTTWLAIKVGLDDLPPFLSASIRFAIAAFFLFLIVRFRRTALGRGGKEPHRFYFTISFIWITLPYGLVYWAEQFVSSGLSAILFATMPIYVAVMGHFWLVGERLNLKKIFGLLIGFFGLLVIFIDTAASPGIGAVYGLIALMVSPVLAAVSTVLVKRRIDELNPVSMNFYVMMYGAIFLFLTSMALERGRPLHFTPTAVFTLVYLGTLGSAIAFVTYIYLLRSMTALKMSLMVYITPVIALFVGWLFRGEVITANILIGSALVFLGIYLASKRD